jgi:hypothetical protein
MPKACHVFVLFLGLISGGVWAQNPTTSQVVTAPQTKPASASPLASQDSNASKDSIAATRAPVVSDTAVQAANSSSTVKPPEPAKPSMQEPTPLEVKGPEPIRQAPDYRFFNDPPLLAREYSFGMAGSLVAGALSFYIGSGIESAFNGSKAHKGTLKFTGIRYDNYYGAFYGGATGLLLGSALTTYFVGQTDEEEGGFFSTLVGSALTTGGALALASWIGVNDEISMVPFIPLLALPSLGSVIGFNLSRMFYDRKREKTVGTESAFHIRPPSLGWSRSTSGGDCLVLQALNLGF